MAMPSTGSSRCCSPSGCCCCSSGRDAGHGSGQGALHELPVEVENQGHAELARGLDLEAAGDGDLGRLALFLGGGLRAGAGHAHDDTVTPPIWLDELGRRRPTRPVLALRRRDPDLPVADRGSPAGRVAAVHAGLVHGGGGHPQEIVAIPEARGYCWLIPIVGGAG